jgi:hypothetical protein
MGVRLRAHRLQASSKRIDVARDHGDAVAGLVGGTNSKCDNGAAVASDEILAAGLKLASPAVSAGQLKTDETVRR